MENYYESLITRAVFDCSLVVSGCFRAKKTRFFRENVS